MSILLAIALLIACKPSPKMPKPTEIRENEKGEQEGAYRKYYEDTRRAALGENWERITQENFENATQSRLYPREDNIAGGLLQGNWYERGSSNVAGSTFATYFYPSTEEIYAISSSGTLYKGGLTGNPWTILSEPINFNRNILAVVPISGGKRIITAKSDHKIYYSDDEAATWTQAAGSISNPHNWGAGGKKLIVLSNGIMFYLQHVWLGSPWGSGYVLHRSANNGATWAAVQSFGLRNDNRVAMWSPFGSDELYLFENGTTLYSLAGTATTLTTLTSSMTFPTDNDYSLTGYKNGSNLTLYVLRGLNVLYKTTDNGANWRTGVTLPYTSWAIGIHANPWAADVLYYGDINLHKSSDGGASFTEQNQWWEYYANIDLLHADMMTITPFQKTNGTKFLLIGNHGGIHYYPDPYTTTTNLTKTNFNNTEYYDVVTINGTIFAGTQDQGNQRFIGGTGTNIQTATQLISGDYVRLNTSLNGTKYWQEYPGGVFDYYLNPLTDQYAAAAGNVYGTARTNIQQWVVPTCNWATATENAILVGGGSQTSGNSTESHVIKLTYNGTGTLTKYEFQYEFMNAGGGYITAIDHSPADVNYMYVGLNNGKFFYSRDGGYVWALTNSFTGPTSGWNYGSFIYASRLNKNLVFYSGGGGKIYKTTDGGVTFSDMSTGLPNTFVSEMVLNPAETLLFAATDAGPYVCVLSTGQWYSMANATTPVKEFRAVEYVTSENVVRFATFGRGIWDFKVTNAVLPVSFIDFNAKEADNQQVHISWTTENERDLAHFEVEKSSDGVHFTILTQAKANNKGSRYTVTDNQPLLEDVNYYRIKSVDLSGKTELTKVKSVKMRLKSSAIAVFPTVLQKGDPLSINGLNGRFEVYLFDNQGRNMAHQTLINRSNQWTLPNLSNGVYFYSIRDTKNVVVKTGKLMIL